jgi:alkanesulfonate monooxygenase SsuD/methylene tetrahydromethanopterin reductase-like flavin-dependent oxidoreductase (luciferase family)
MPPVCDRRAMAAAPPLGFGITAGPRPWLGDLAGELERLGYAQLWSNDTPGRSGLTTLAPCATTTAGLLLAVGVVPLSEHSPSAIVADLEDSRLPAERTVVGVGSGRSRSLALVRDGVERLRAARPDVRVAVAAVGPRMCRLAGEVADVVLLNWVAPPRIAIARQLVARGAAEAERGVPLIAAYVRAAIGPDAAARLAAEADRYRRRGGSYGRAFAVQAEAAPGGVAVERPAQVAAALEAYRAALDVCVVRGLPESDAPDAWLEIARAAA